MKKRTVLLIIICLLAAVLLGVAGYTVMLEMNAAQVHKAREGETFSCYTYDGNGNRLDAYRAFDGNWYLFVTATQSIPELELHYTGLVDQSTGGLLYKQDGRITEAFHQSGDQIHLVGEDGSVNTVVVMQSALPSVYIDLEGITLDGIHADKDAKHKGNSICISDPNGRFDLTVENSLEIKGWDHSTWHHFEKKAYQIKFAEKTSVMGMGKAKNWVLLANASDDSMMRTQLVHNMADQLDMAYVPSFEYVDLWIEGEYRGTYLLGEKVESGTARLDLTQDSGALFAYDEGYNSDGTQEDDWFENKLLEKHFVMKEIVEAEAEIIDGAIADFDEAVNELMAYLYSTPSQDVTLEALSKMIDVDSFAKYYLINEYTLNLESFATSFYWHKDGAEDVLHMGPIWGYDTCMGNDGTANTESYGTEHVLFRYLLAAPAFNQRCQELLETYGPVLEGMAGDTANIAAQIESSAQMNYTRWSVLGKPNPMGGVDFYPTFEAAAEALRTWLEGRWAAFTVAESAVVTSVVSEDCYDMDLCFRDNQSHDEVVFAVWSVVDGQDDLAWYPAKQDADGVWRAKVDLGRHNSAGMYDINAYTDNQQVLLAAGQNYVETARTIRYPMEVTLSEDGQMLNIRLEDTTGKLTGVRFALWGQDAGQADSLQWLTAELVDGCWTVQVSVCGLKLERADAIMIHAYGADTGPEVFLNEAQFQLEKIMDHVYEEEEDGVCSLCGYDPEQETQQ